MEDEESIFVRKASSESESFTAADDVWEDSALIKAYDKAVNLAKDKVAKKIETEAENSREKFVPSKKSNRSKINQKWSVGMPCRAVYSVDGLIYEARVTKIYEDVGRCLVTFIGYGNTEEIKLSELRESKGWQSQKEQERIGLATDDDWEAPPRQANSASNASHRTDRSTDERMEYENESPRRRKDFFPNSYFDSSIGIVPPAPPLPPQLMSKLPENDADALSSMLMSWYISGFHTGYYHGIKQARQSQEKHKK